LPAPKAASTAKPWQANVAAAHCGKVVLAWWVFDVIAREYQDGLNSRISWFQAA
jgi:hypothetical protein